MQHTFYNPTKMYHCWMPVKNLKFAALARKKLTTRHHKCVKYLEYMQAHIEPIVITSHCGNNNAYILL